MDYTKEDERQARDAAWQEETLESPKPTVNVAEPVAEKPDLADKIFNREEAQNLVTQPDGWPKPTDEVIDPKDYGTLENAKELGKAVAAGGIDIVNSFGSLPKWLDPKFHQPKDPNNPYVYKAPWIINRKPITRTRWGGFVQNTTELIGGLIGVGKVLSSVKALQWADRMHKAGKLKTAVMSGIQGGVYDVISNQSQEQNIARSLIDAHPRLEPVLGIIATNDYMSPAVTSFYNIGEGAGIGAQFDVAATILGTGSRKLSQQYSKLFKKNTVQVDEVLEAVTKNSDEAYDLKTGYLETLAKNEYNAAQYRKTKSKIGIEKWKKTNDPWKKLPLNEQEAKMSKWAEKKNIDWGEERNFDRRRIKQQAANKDVADEQLERDLAVNGPRRNAAYYKGNAITDNNAITTGDTPMESVRDSITIRNDINHKYGSPRGVVTEANIRRIEYQAPGTTIDEINSLAKQLVKNPEYQHLYNGASKEVITQDLALASRDLMQFINESGHSRLMEIPEADVVKYIKSKDAGNPTIIEGLSVLNREQLVSTDVILGQMLYEARDLAKAALSISDQIDVSQPGSVLDGILARYAYVSRLRKETSMMVSYDIKRFDANVKDSPVDAIKRGELSDEAANEIATLKVLLQNDPSDELLQTFLHFTAANNGNKQGFKDFTQFMHRNIHGYQEGDQFTRNALIREFQVMGMNSMLSGPKTPVRALVGTGLGTVMRPVATIIGSAGDYLKGQDEVTRGAFANLGGMVSGMSDSWRKAVADFQSYAVKEEGFRGYIPTQSDLAHNARVDWAETYGSIYDKAVMRTSDFMRGVNKIPLFHMGPRIMSAQDTFADNIIGRGRLKELAFKDVYSKLKDANLVVSDEDFADLIKAAEGHFEGKVFTADGKIADEMVKFAADEAKLTKELTGRVKSIERVFDRTPYLKPFFLFARTGVNALEMTSKYTPGLNNFITEHYDIMTKSWDDPEMLKYGIKTADDLEIAKATMRGRQAIGNGVAFSAAWMALNGKITGNGPPDRGLRDSWTQLSGWQPRSIKIGDKYVSYEALEPFNMILSFAADVVDGQKVMGQEWAGDWYGRLAYLISANVTNRSFMAGLLQMQDVLTSRGADTNRVLGSFLNYQLPLGSARNEIGKIFSPGMRELESGILQSIGNRNLWVDLLGDGKSILPYKYDILSGEKIKSYDPWTRFHNAVSPFQINIGTTPTREFLFRSGLNLKQTFNTGPDGQSLRHLPNLRSKYQFLISQQNIEQQLKELFRNPQIVQSIYDMEADRASGRGVAYESEDNLHSDFIRQIFKNAKRRAWKQLLDSEDNTAGLLTRLHKYEELEAHARKAGKSKRVKLLRSQIEELKKLIYK